MIPGSANPLLLKSAAAAGGYQVSRSLRFNAPDSAYLSRTPAVAGNRKTWTWAGWVKRSALGVDEAFFEAKPASGGWFALIFGSDNRINIGHLYGISYNWATNAVFRDSSAWYHIVAVCDTTSATSTITGTATDRLRLYVNGTQQSLGVFGSPPPASPPAQNADLQINDTVPHHIGRYSATTSYSNFCLADIHFIDGQALTPSSFTEVSATTGQLIPKTYSGSYGTNGFQLKFADNSSNTAATLGKDTSGNSNNWTPNNLSVTAGAGNDSLVDTPTSYGTDTGVGNEVRGNYCTLNPLDKNASATLTNGNLNFYNSAASHYLVRSTFGIVSGKWYWETTIPSDASSPANFCSGVCRSTASLSLYVGGDSNGWGLLGNGNTQNSSGSAYTSALALGDVIGVAFDADSGKIWWSKNGSYPNSGNPATGANATYSNVTSGSGPYFPAVSAYQSAAIFNGGQRAFAYTAPSGFKALCDTNLGAPVVAKPNTLMDVALYTGNGSTQTISGLGFSPDLVWIKSRNNAGDPANGVWHNLFDIIRGTGKTLFSNTTSPEATNDSNGYLNAFNADGFGVTTGSNSPNNVNNATGTYAAWCWDAGTSTVSNTAGSITSQVRANASAGFSVVTYTGTGSAATIGHGLGVSPSLIITKARSNSSGWAVYHASLGATKALELNDTAAASTTNVYWNNTAPTSTVFSVLNGTTVNASGYTYVGYCFAPVVGYSSFGSYVGNLSADGVFVHTGFRPRWVLVRRVAGQWWFVYDSARYSYNQAGTSVTPGLFPNLSNAESATNSAMDFLSNGFKLRIGDNATNDTSEFIYAAFAESPFQYARAR